MDTSKSRKGRRYRRRTIIAVRPPIKVQKLTDDTIRDRQPASDKEAEIMQVSKGPACRPPLWTGVRMNPEITDVRTPEHVAIIMDGNGRWAKAARPAAPCRSQGRRRGAARTVRVAGDAG
jgi:hypothetical protein